MKQLSRLEGFVLSVGHGARKRRMEKALLPESAMLSIDLDLMDVIADLDAGMIDWSQSPQIAWT